MLDSILEQIITPIMKFLQTYVKRAVQDSNHHIKKDVSYLFEIIYWLCKIRNSKTVMKFFPHEVADMEPVVEMLHF